MPLSLEQNAALAALGLKKGDPLHTLATILIEAPSSPQNEKWKAKSQWDDAVDTFLRTLRLPKRSDGMTPLKLFIHVFRFIKNPVDLFQAIRTKATNPKKPIDIGLYDSEILSLTIDNLYASQIRLSDVYFLRALMTPSQRQSSEEHISKLSQPITDISEIEWRTLLQKICICTSPGFNTRTRWSGEDILDLLLNCKPLVYLNGPLAIKMQVRDHQPTTLCELACAYHSAALKSFIPRTNLENRLKAFKLALHEPLTKSMIEILLEGFKGVTEGASLLDHLSKSNGFTPDLLEYDGFTKLVQNVLDSGYVCNPSLMTTLLSCQDVALQETAKFLEHLQTQKPSIQTLLETLRVLEHGTDSSLILNARDTCGNTLFYTIFDTLMQADASYFDRLVHLIFIKNINPSLNNSSGKTIYSSSYLSDAQKKCIQVAQTLRNAKNIIKDLTSDQYSDLEKAQFNSSLTKMRIDAMLLLEQLPQETTKWMSLFHFEILKLHCFFNGVWDLLPQAFPFAENIYALMEIKEKQNFRYAFDLTLSYIKINNNRCAPLGKILNNVLDILLKNLKQCPETLDLTEKYFTLQKIQNPYKVAFQLPQPECFQIVDSLLTAGLSPDVLNVDTVGNSLLNLIMGSNQPSTISLMLEKLNLCPRSLALPNKQGNTPLHTAFMSNTTTRCTTKLMTALMDQKQNLDTLNQQHYTPFYLAIQANRLQEARMLLSRAKVSVQHHHTGADSLEIMPLNLWALSCMAFTQRPHATTEEEKKELKEQIKRSLEFFKLLLEHGCHFDNDSHLSLDGLKILCSSLWHQEELQNPFNNFCKNRDKLHRAWKTIGNIAVGKSESYNSVYSLIGLNLSNTRRLSDDKTMFEIILALKTKLKETADATQDNSQPFQKRMSYLNKILLSLIAGGADVQGSDSNNYKVCSHISQQCIRFCKDLQQTKTRMDCKLEESEDIQSKREASWRESAKQIFDQLTILEHPDYTSFKAFVYYQIASALFWVDKETKTPYISQVTLMFIRDSIQKSVVLLEQFEHEENANLSKQIIKLNADIARHLPVDSVGRMKDILITLIQPSQERKLRLEHCDQWAEIDTLLSTYADGSWNPSDTTSYSLHAAILDAFQRGGKKIQILKQKIQELVIDDETLDGPIEALECRAEALRKENQESRTENEAQAERITALEKQLLEKEKSLPTDTGSIPPPPVLMHVRKRVPMEDIDPIQSEKRKSESEEDVGRAQTDKRQKH